jgi:hypothetical protein
MLTERAIQSEQAGIGEVGPRQRRTDPVKGMIHVPLNAQAASSDARLMMWPVVRLVGCEHAGRASLALHRGPGWRARES